MKFLISLLFVLLIVPAYATTQQSPGKGKIKEVCEEKIDKQGKTFKECKKIKVRKKLKGTEVPPTKK